MCSLRDRLRHLAIRLLFNLPSGVLRLLATKKLDTPGSVAGMELDPQAHLMIALANLRPLNLETLTPEESRRLSAGITEFFGLKGLPVRHARDLAIPGPDSDLNARLYVPKSAADKGPLLVYFHGGGFVEGSLATTDPLCRFLSERSRIRLLSVEYRKAPENPFPAAVNDTCAAFRWALDNASELGALQDRIAVGGDSSGANLAASVTLLTQNDSKRPFYQVLLYPALDASKKSASFKKFGTGLGLTEGKYDWFLDHYSKVEERTDPRISPLLAEDLSRLPPALIVTAGLDILRDEGMLYAERLRAAGISVDERCCDGLFHGFARFYQVIRSAESALEEIATVLAKRMTE